MWLRYKNAAEIRETLEKFWATHLVESEFHRKKYRMSHFLMQ